MTRIPSAAALALGGMLLGPSGALAQDAPQSATDDASSLGSAIGADPLASLRVRQEDYPSDGVTIGQGWDSFLRRKAPGSCVNANVARIVDNTVNFDYRRIDDKEHLFRSLNIAASGKYSGGAFSASGSLNFAKSTTIDTSALNILAQVNVDKGGEYLVPVNSGFESGEMRPVAEGEIGLSDSALKLIKTRRFADFYRLCGDSFVITIRSGAKLSALFKLKTYKFSEKQKLEVELKAKGFGSSGSASFKQRIEQKRDHDDLELSYVQAGGNTETVPTDAVSLLERLKLFASKQDFVPRNYQVSVVSYEALKDWDFSASVKTPAELEEIANHYWRLMDLSDQFTSAGLSPDDYVLYGRDTSASEGAAVNKNRVSSDDIFDISDRILTAAKLLDLVLTKCVRERSCDENQIVRAIVSAAKENQPLASSDGDVILGSENLLTLLVDAVGSQALASLNEEEIKALKSQDPLATVSEVKGDTLLPSFMSMKSADDATEENKANIEANEPKLNLKATDNFSQYYYWLALKPIKRGKNEKDYVVEPEINTKTLLSDAEFAVLASGKGAITSATASLGAVSGTAQISGKKEILDEAANRLRERILTDRLIPTSRSFCQISVTHPMCKSVADLKIIVGSVPIVLTQEDLEPKKAPPPAARRAAPRKRPAPRVRDYPCLVPHNYSCL